VKDFAENHNGGQLQFGPDGRLWWGNGDGGGGGDPEHNGQSLARPFAKIMKLNVANPKARWQLVAYGLRNPWRFSFDRATNDLYIGDVGQGDREEIDYLRRGFTAPVNFGWNHWEGKRIYDSSTRLLARGRYVPPVVDYSHDEGCSVTGGYVYRGKAVKAAVGRYFYGDYCSGTIWSLRIVGGRATQVRREPFRLEGLSSFGEDASGELYAMSLNGGLYRLAG
jgi:glucose/arabinose dehydrogenase